MVHAEIGDLSRLRFQLEDLQVIPADVDQIHQHLSRFLVEPADPVIIIGLQQTVCILLFQEQVQIFLQRSEFPPVYSSQIARISSGLKNFAAFSPKIVSFTNVL